jgi:hypothetical protein
MRFESFKNLADGIQALMIALGVLVGGVWALIRFWSLRSIETARAELEKAHRELVSRGFLEVQLHASQLNDAHRGTMYINLLLEIRNVGTGTEVIRWEDSKISAALVTLDEQGQVELSDGLTGSFLRIDDKPVVFSTISPKAKEYDSFIIPVVEPGIYLIDVDLCGSPTETAASAADAKSAGVEAETLTWGSNAYFQVAPSSVQKSSASAR